MCMRADMHTLAQSRFQTAFDRGAVKPVAIEPLQNDAIVNLTTGPLLLLSTPVNVQSRLLSLLNVR